VRESRCGSAGPRRGDACAAIPRIRTAVVVCRLHGGLVWTVCVELANPIAKDLKRHAIDLGRFGARRAFPPSSEGDDGFRFQRVYIQCGMGMPTPRFRSFDIIRYRPSSGDFHYRSGRVVRREYDSRRYDHAPGSALVTMSERPGETLACLCLRLYSL
jgi:hypothetical protein